MSDMALTDMGPFMRRHDRRSRRIFVALLATSLLVSAAAFIYGVREYSSPGALPGRLWFGILFYPLPIIGLWVVGVFWARKRVTQPDGRLPMNPDDGRNAARVANVGAVYAAGISLVLIVNQVVLVLGIFHVLPMLGREGNWFGRAMLVVSGALVAYFGNAWPRFPASRGPGYKPATQRKFNRFLGWMLVIHGLLFVLAGLLLPPNPTVYTVGALTIGLSMMLFTVGWVVTFHRAMKSPSAA